MPQARSSKGADDIRPGFNNTGATLLRGTVVKRGTTKGHILPPAADTDHIHGVLIADIPDQTWGDVQVRGTAVCRAAGALATLGVQLKADTDGKVTTWSASAGSNAHVVGTLESAAAAEDDEVEVELAGPGTIKQG